MAKKAKVNTPAPTIHVAKGAAPPVPKGAPDPCRHRRNKKKKQKFIVYISAEKGKTGNYYVGRTRGKGTVTQVILKRQQGHHRTDIGYLTPVCETDTYSACRGAEMKHYAAMEAKNKLIKTPRSPGRGKQIAPIKDDNPRKDDYIACAEATARSSPTGCKICAA
jgi:hypothetical protein